jgi:hypothetical protein
MKKNNNEITKSKKLAAEILGHLNGVMTKKLRELKPQLQELRLCFTKLGKRNRIEGCRTWAQFCSEKLHRTDRAVRKLLAEVKTGETEETHTGTEESSAACDESKATSEAPAENTHEASVEEKRTSGRSTKKTNPAPARRSGSFSVVFQMKIC